jgi:hypothetical protein
MTVTLTPVEMALMLSALAVLLSLFVFRRGP